MKTLTYQFRPQERGNVLFMVLLAVVLLGVLTAAIQSGTRPEGTSIDRETMIIRATEVQRYTGELERAVQFVLQNGVSENDIRFAHYDAPKEYGDLADAIERTNQIFHRDGGGAAYRPAPKGINDGSGWEFFGGTAIPQVGSNRPELVAVLPNVTKDFCERINSVNDLTGQPLDPGSGSASARNAGACVNLGTDGRFGPEATFYEDVNEMDDKSFSKKPATQGCVQCTGRPGSPYHFYHVLLSR